MFPSTLKSKAGVYRFSPDEERFWKAPFWWGISVDGRPTVQNKATFFSAMPFVTLVASISNNVPFNMNGQT